MITLESNRERVLERALQAFRPAVRREHAYLVGGAADYRVKLNQNESPFDLPPDLKREIVEAFLDIPFNRYPAEQPLRLRAALAESLGVSEEHLLVGNGSNELTTLIGLCLVERGTPVVMPRPMFALYEKVIRLFDGEVIAVPPRPDLGFDAGAVLTEVERRRPALTVITSPNNPTGLAMTFAEIERIVEAAEGVVLVDEAYIDFSDIPSLLNVLDRRPNMVVMRTFSKAYGLAGLRLGYLVAHPHLIREFIKANTPFTVDPLAEAAAVALLNRKDLLRERIETIRQSTAQLEAGLAAMESVQIVGPSKANFVIFRTDLEAGVLAAGLARADVLVRNMSGYPELQGFLRVNAGTPAENRRFLEALKDRLDLLRDGS